MQKKPITPYDLLHKVIRPTLAKITEIPPSKDAERMLLTICGQETNFEWTRQVLSDGSPGPASGRWQFERGGGVRGVMRHAASKPLAQKWAALKNLPFDESAIWAALEHDDELACVWARLLLWTDPYSIPTEVNQAWVCYAERLWRPGKPHPDKWEGYWHTANDTLDLVAPPVEDDKDQMINALLEEIEECVKRIRSLLP